MEKAPKTTRFFTLCISAYHMVWHTLEKSSTYKNIILKNLWNQIDECFYDVNAKMLKFVDFFASDRKML